MFGCPGITHTCLDLYPSLQVPPPELTPSLPAHSHLLFPLPHSLTASAWHLRLGVAGSCLSSHHSPVRGKLTFWRCCLGPQPLVFVCSLSRARSLLCWRAATSPARGQVSRKPFPSTTGRVKAISSPSEPLRSPSAPPQCQCQSFERKSPLGSQGSQRVKEA